MAQVKTNSNVYAINKKRWSVGEIIKIFDNFTLEKSNYTDHIVDPKGVECFMFFKPEGPNDFKCDGYRWRNQR